MMDRQLFFFYFEVEEKDETSLLASEYIVINMKPFYSSTKNYIPRIKACMVYLEQKKG